MDFTKPPRLVPGKSVIGLVAPSGVVEKEGLEKGIKILTSWGFSVKLGRHIMARQGDYSAGTDQQRAEDLLEMIANPEINAIGCLAGGFAGGGLLKILKPETLAELKKKPKLFWGYSDFSLILNALFSQKIVSLYAPNLVGFYQRSLTTQKSLRLSLLGGLLVEIGPLFDWKPIVPGFAQGRLLVANLQSLVDVLGTAFDPLAGNDNEGLILALEEVGENKSTISRWLERLASHRQSVRIKGIILGRFTKIGEKDYPAWGREISVEQVFLKIFGQKRLPLACLPEFGHTEEEKRFLRPKSREKIDFLSLPCGVRVLFKVKSESCRLKFLEKAIS